MLMEYIFKSLHVVQYIGTDSRIEQENFMTVYLNVMEKGETRPLIRLFNIKHLRIRQNVLQTQSGRALDIGC